MMQFNEMNLLPEIVRAVEEMGYAQPTDIQAGAIPLFLEGRDLIGRSSTGTGKTAAFGIPVVQRVAQSGGRKTQVLILSPTRELAIQTSDELHKFSKYLHNVSIATVCGGQSMPGQIRQLRTAQIVIGTPGRIMDHMRRRTLSLEQTDVVILDEADEMLNMGFLEDIQTILTQTPESRQTVLFSATMPPQILGITKEFQKDPEMIAVDQGRRTVEGISQFYYNVPQSDKINALKLLLEYHHPKRALIFCNTKKMVDELCGELNDSGFQAVGLHGDLKQNQRNQVMDDFKSGRCALLIATDVAARGIDVEGVDAVFNYDVPQENEYYVHRIGRTGRAGRTGASYTLAAGRTQLEKVRTLERFMGTDIREAAVPSLEDVRERRMKKFMGSVKKMAEENSGIEWIPFIESLEEEGYPAKNIAAALCAAMNGQNRRLDSVKNVRRAAAIPAEKGLTSLNIDIGTNDKLKPDFLIGAIVEATGLPVGAIGKISIYGDHTKVELSPADANLVIRKMAGYKIKQRTLHFTASAAKQQERGHAGGGSGRPYGRGGSYRGQNAPTGGKKKAYGKRW
jgi:Superfamily II DNA and RNA helicases